MKIIIAGAGEVGFHLAKLLSFESQDITLIDNEKANLTYADTHLDIKVVKGNSASLTVLNEAAVSSADLMIAVTSSETTNFTTCVLAKQLGVKSTVARISNTEYVSSIGDIDFKSLGIDELISPEELASDEIQLLIDQSAFSNSHEFEDGALTMRGTTLQEGAPFIGKTVKEAAEVYPGVHFMPIAIQRSGTQFTMIPSGDTFFNKHDQVYFTTLPEGVDELYDLMGSSKEKIQNVMILGGGRVGIKTARDLSERGYYVKLVEINKTKANEIADMLPQTLIIHGDGRDVDLLNEENLTDMDAFISVTGNSETNIMTCLMAKSKNVKKTIALVENIDYFELSQSIGIDTLINKKLLAANSIFRYVRRGDVVDVAKLHNMNAEILEFIVNEQSKVLGKKIKDLEFPRSASIGGVIREGKGIIALGDFEILPGDRVLVCCLPRSIKRVERLFL
jgi:trk system potassium uptake protein TrkA